MKKQTCMRIDKKIWPFQYEEAEMQPSGMTCVLSSDKSSTMYFNWIEYREFERTRQYIFEKIHAKFRGRKITKDCAKELKDYLLDGLHEEIKEDLKESERLFDGAINLRSVKL